MSVPEPSITLKAFSCPHCGAHADQSWFDLLVARNRSTERTPAFADDDAPAKLRKKLESVGSESQDARKYRAVLRWAEGMLAKEPFLWADVYNNADGQLGNVFVSQCYACERLALWVHDSLMYPPKRSGAQPHADLPEEIRIDFEEARSIVGLSPRGAAALLRLCIQKLCKEIGEKGSRIDEDIASLVAKGLDEHVQQALDSVRVIGNESVHPGQIDLRDDRDTALLLFELVNDITAHTIARKKRAAELYSRLPAEKRKAIEERNAKALSKSAANGPS